MSMFGMRGGNVSPSGVNQEKVDMAAAQLDIVTEMFHKLSSACFNKCVSRFSEGDLTTGESLCVDRCVAKYFEANNKVGERMQAAGGMGGPGAGPAVPGKGGLF